MGSMCSSGGGETKQTGSVAPSPDAMSAYQGILSRAQQVASQPYVQYGGQLTAGLDPTQQAGIANINAAYGMAQPYYNAAQQYAQQGAGAVNNIGGADIQRYYNPYQQMVIDATMGNINEADQRQQQMVKGNAAMSGALGGDRQAVAQAELARQQGLARNQTLAGLQSQGYQQALQTAQSQQQNQQANAQRALSAAGMFGNLGTGAQQAQLAGAGAQLGAGQVAQQTEQQRLSSLYNQFQQQQAYPYQQLNWLAGIAAPIGSQMGQTQTQTTTAPEKDNTAQYAGMAMTAAALMFSDRRMKENVHKIGETNDGQPIYRYNYKGDPTTQIGLISQEVEKSHPEAVYDVNGVGAVDYDVATAGSIRRAFGGRVGYAVGGSPYSDISGYVPPPLQLGARPLQGSLGTPAQEKSDSGMGALSSGVNSLAGAFGKTGSSGLADMTGGATTNWGYNSSMFPDTFAANYGTADQLFPGYGMSMGFADGGLVDAVRAIRKGLKSYQDGGEVEEMPFISRWEPTAAPGNIRTIDIGPGDWAPQEVSPEAMADWRGAADLTRNDAGGHGTAPPVSPAVDLPPEITAGRSGPVSPYPVAPQTMAYDRPSMRSAAPSDALPERAQAATRELKRTGLFGLLTEEQQAGLLAAGAGMMAHGPTLKGQWLTGVGAGIQQGMKGVSEFRKGELARTKEERNADAEARRLELARTTSQRNADAEARRLMHDIKKQDLEERKLEETKWLHRNKPVMGVDRDGFPVMLNPLTGEPIGRPQETKPQQGSGPPLPFNVPGTTTAASEEEQGIIPANARLVQGGSYDYKDDAPYIEKGMDVPAPQGVAGRSSRTLQTDAEYYLQTGKLPTVRGGKSPVAIQDTQYKRAVQNYAGALAQSRGLTPEQAAETWRTAPGMLRFILGADGRATVSLGTAVRHLDTVKQLAEAWKEGSTVGNWQTWNRLTSSVRREFGDAAVTNLESAGRIVGPEIIKALGVAGAGTEHDRNTAANQFLTGKGYDQILGAVETTQKLLGGQLEGKKRQAANAGVSEERFKSLMGERAYEVLSHAEKGHGKEGKDEPKFTGRTATGPGGKKLRETTTGDWVP